MFDREIHNHYTNNHSSANVEINEHRAPTDDSIRILNEMERKAQDNFIMKLCDNRPNSLHAEILFFQQIASLDSFEPKGTMVVMVQINGKQYERKVDLNCSFTRWALEHRHECHRWGDITDDKVRQYIFLQLMIIITQAILDDPESGEFMLNKIQTNGPINLSLGDIQDELQYIEDYSKL